MEMKFYFCTIELILKVLLVQGLDQVHKITNDSLFFKL